MTRGRAGLIGALVIVAGSACSPGQAPLPFAPHEVVLKMSDYHFKLVAPSRRGRVVFRVTNAGHVTHRLVLVPIPEDFPPVAEQVRGATRRNVDPVAGIADRKPGETGTFAVDLAAGRYAVVCLITDPDGKTHAQKGMATEFRVK